MRLLFLSALLLVFMPYSWSSSSEFNKSQITYLMQAKEPEKSITLYSRYKNALGKHDFEILQQMAFILLEQGARSPERETQLLSIFGSGIASAASSLDILEAGIKSKHAETQVASIQFLGRMQDDRSDELLVKAMSSEFFFARMEAAMHLATRKHKTSVGQIESLMYRVPPQARFFFPQFFALIGTSDAISILRHLMEDRVAPVRVEALLSAARFGRDDLLPAIRMNITHLNVAEQEAAAYAVGILKDSRSRKKLRRLYDSSSSNVQIAAARSLLLLGDPEAKDFLLKKAAECNLFAIVSLDQIPEGKDLLAKLCSHPDLAIRVNAAITLLKHRDPRCKKILMDILVRDSRDMGFTPQISLGKTLLAFKPVFSSEQQKGPFDVRSITLSIREQLLIDAMHLSEEDFLNIAEVIFNSRQTDLIATLVSLLENLQTPKALDLLMRKAQVAGMPLVRAYCNLALFRLGKEGPYEGYLREWITRNKDSEMIRFRPLVPMDKRLTTNSPHELTPEDSSRLLIEAYQTFSEKQQEGSIEILLEAIKNGNPKNRYVLAGLLLRTLQ